MAEAIRRALLDIDTLVERPFISIDGQHVDILNPDELSVIESHRFGVWGRRIEALSAETGEAAEKELDELVSIVARKICVGASDELFATLPGSKRWAIIDLFTGLLLRSRLKVAGAMAAAMGELPEWFQSLTGGSSSPASSDSMAAGRRTGWKRYLPDW
ncbi:MAG: hypothetical protein WC692_07395 [Erythrobacter sp.]|jgi:hypothetical protein